MSLKKWMAWALADLEDPHADLAARVEELVGIYDKVSWGVEREPVIEVRRMLRQHCGLNPTPSKPTEEEYRECATCAAKTGCPTLCPSCLHNRGLVMDLQARLAAVGKDLDDAYKRITELRSKSESYRQCFDNEIAGATELRKKHGARPDESFPMFIDRLASELKQVKAESDGRRRALLEMAADRRNGWQRAEVLAVHDRDPVAVRDQLSEIVGRLTAVRDRLANTSSPGEGS